MQFDLTFDHRAPEPAPRSPMEGPLRDAVIVEAVRTPVGKRRNGTLSGIHPVDLSAHVLRSLVDRAGVDPAEGR